MIKSRLLFPFILLFGGAIAAYSQPVCTNSSESPAETCGEACIGCQMNGYSGSTAGWTSSGNTYCSGEIVEMNSVWHAFIAGASSMTITVTNTNCTMGQGVQIAVLPDCNAEAIACDPGFVNGATLSKSVVANVVPGNTYFLLVNGRDGDVCDYHITAPNTALTPPPTVTGPINGLSQVCAGATTTYIVPASSNLLSYEWTAPAGSSINGGGNTLTLPYPEGAQVTITFPNTTGSGQVTLRGLGACGATTATVTKTVQRVTIAPTHLPLLLLYPEDLPYYWEVNGTEISTTGSFVLSDVLTSWQGCDSVVQQAIIVQPHVSGRAYWDMNGNNVYNPGVDIPLENQTILTTTGDMASTDADGLYELPTLVAGTKIQPGALPNFTVLVNPAFQTYISGTYSGYNFAFKPQKGPASGVVYIDNDQNGSYNAGDTPVNNISINTSLGNQTLTDANGAYTLNNLAYLETISVLLPGDYELDGPGVLTYAPNVNTGYNFRVRPHYAFGNVWWDVDQDYILSAGDVPAKNITLVSSTGAQTNTGNSGAYSFNGLTSGDTIRVLFPGIGVTPGFQVVSANPPSGGYPFLLQAANVAPDLSIDLTNIGVFRPGFNNKLRITVKNETLAYVQNASVSVRFPGFLNVQSILPNASFAGSDSLYWNLGGMAPQEIRQFTVSFFTPPTSPLGTIINFEGWVNPTAGDIDPANNYDLLILQVVGAYDPNDKQVEPAFITPVMLASPKPFEYTIRFQNTGNYPADHVQIIDTLRSTVDWSTVRLLSSSHPCTWSLSPDGVLKVQFPNILLPDSVSNEPESHGFVKFAVAPVQGLSIGDQVSNNCDIYFDFNPPVRTNTAVTQVVYFLPGTEIQPGSKAFSARPVPAVFNIRFSWPDLTTASGKITLYNVNGVPVAAVALPENVNEAMINVAQLPNGIYMAVMEAGNLFYTKRVVVMRNGPIRRGE